MKNQSTTLNNTVLSKYTLMLLILTLFFNCSGYGILKNMDNEKEDINNSNIDVNNNNIQAPINIIKENAGAQSNKSGFQKIDNALGKYYESKEREDYFDISKVGKFMKYVEEQGFDEDDLNDELDDANMEDCGYLDFDENFPYTNENLKTSQKREELFTFLKQAHKNDENIPIPDEDKIKEIESAPEKLIIRNNNNNLNGNEHIFCQEQKEEKEEEEEKSMVSKVDTDKAESIINKVINGVKNKNKIQQIDELLKVYYELNHKHDYLDENGIGRFKSYCDDNGFDDDSLLDEFSDADDCMLTGFDDTFTCPDGTEKESLYLFNLLKDFYDNPENIRKYQNNYYSSNDLTLDIDNITDKNIKFAKVKYNQEVIKEFDSFSKKILLSATNAHFVYKDKYKDRPVNFLSILQHWEYVKEKRFIEPFDNVYLLSKLYSINQQKFDKGSFFKALKKELYKITSNEKNNMSDILKKVIHTKRSTIFLASPIYNTLIKFTTQREKIVSILYACMNAWKQNINHNVNFVFIGKRKSIEKIAGVQDEKTTSSSASDLWQSIKDKNKKGHSFTYDIPTGNKETFSKKDLDLIIEKLSDKHTKDLFYKIMPCSITKRNSEFDIKFPKYSELQEKIHNAIIKTADNCSNNKQRITVAIYLDDEGKIDVYCFHPPHNKEIPKNHHFGWISLAAQHEIMNIGQIDTFENITNQCGTKDHFKGKALFLVCSKETGMTVSWNGQKFGNFINTHTLLKMFSAMFLGVWDITKQQSSSKEKEHKGDCAICMESLNNSDGVQNLDCYNKNHLFHSTCIESWFLIDKTCPICRKSQEKKKEENLDIDVRECDK